MEPRALRDALREAVAAHLIVADAEGRYAFRHALLREVVADDLLPGERAELHLALARALEATRRRPARPRRRPPRRRHRPPLLRRRRPADRAGRQRARRRGGRERARPRRGGGAVRARARSCGTACPTPRRSPGGPRGRCCAAAAVGDRRASTSRRARRRCCAPRWPRSTSEADPLRAAVAAGPRSRTSSSTRAARARPRRRAGARWRCCPTEPSEARAEVLASHAAELMLESRYRESVEVAEEAIADRRGRSATASRRSGRSTAWASRCSALGRRPRTASAALREALHARARRRLREHGADRLRQPRRRAGRRRPPAGGARGSPTRASRWPASEGMRRRWPILLRAELAFEAGDWATAEAALPAPGRPAMGTTYLNEALRRIELALGRGRARARARAARPGRRRRCGHARAAVDRPARRAAGGARASRRRPRGRARGDRRRAGPAGLLLGGRRPDGPRVGDRRARGGRRGRARARPRRGPGGRDRQRARCCWPAWRRAPRSRTTDASAGQRPNEAAFLATARAELARAARRGRPRAVGRGRRGVGRSRPPYRAAQARRREAEALLAARRPRRRREPPRSTRWSPRGTIGAAWLAAEIEGFALRARLRLEREPAQPSRRQPTGDEDPFGLTPRERQVLALLAAGRTNREIGAELYMAEKTASRPRLADPLQARRALPHRGGGAGSPGRSRLSVA